MDTLSIRWEGADGSQWDLLDPLAPVRLVKWEGLGMPSLENRRTDLAVADGLRYDSTRYGLNRPTLTVTVGDDYPAPGFTYRRRGEEWRALDRAFRASLSAERKGSLVVTSEVGERRLALRLDDTFSPPAERQPGELGEATYSLVMAADDQPWWTGEEVTAEFPFTAQARPFFVGEAPSTAPDGALLYVSPQAASNFATIRNPGDRPAFPRWWARGPLSAVSLTIGGRKARLPFALAAEQVVRVDSATQTITGEAGNSLWPLMGYEDPTFSPVPPGVEVPLGLDLEGATSGAAVGVSLVPLYSWPW